MASLLDFLPLFQEDAATIRARIDADANSGIPTDDPRYVDTREGSFFWDITQPLVLEFARVYDLLAVEVPAASFAVFAWGQYLDWHAETFDLTRKAAVAATAEVSFLGDPGTLVASGTIVSTELANEEGDEIEFVTTASGTTGAQLPEPSSVTAPPFTTGGTLPNGTLYYVVTALNAYGETLGSVEVSAVVVGPTGRVDLDWPDVAGATLYRVYKGVVAGGTKGRIYEGATSAFSDTGAVAPGLTGPPDQNLTAGVTLPVEAVEDGTIGNVGAFAISNLDTPNLGIDAVRNEEAATGGTDEEGDEALRERVLLEFQGQGAGIANDYRRWALSIAGVGRVFVNPVWDGPNTVQVVVMTAEGDPVAGPVVDAVQDYLDPTSGLADGKAPPGAEVTVQTTSVNTIDVGATIVFEAGYSLDGGGGTTARRAEIQASLEEYLNKLDVGEDVVYEHVKSRFFDVEGIYNISAVTVEGGTADVAITSDPPVSAQLGVATLT